MENITNKLGAYIIFNNSSSQSLAHDEHVGVVFGNITKYGNAGNFAELTVDKKIKISERGTYIYTALFRMDGPASNTGFWFCSLPGTQQLIPLVVGASQYMQLSAVRIMERNEELSISVRQTSGSAINLTTVNVVLLRLGDWA